MDDEPTNRLANWQVRCALPEPPTEVEAPMTGQRRPHQDHVGLEAANEVNCLFGQTLFPQH